MINSARILVAGMGNIFFGDDAFGVEVVRELAWRSLPHSVRVEDFGIRSYDLAYALTEDYETIILVDATARGQPPGTLYLVEPSLEALQTTEAVNPDPHSMDPVAVLRMAAALGGVRARLYLVGCEPAVLELEDGQIGLSAPVRQAVPKAVEYIEELVAPFHLSNSQQSTSNAGVAPA